MHPYGYVEEQLNGKCFDKGYPYKQIQRYVEMIFFTSLDYLAPHSLFSLSLSSTLP